MLFKSEQLSHSLYRLLPPLLHWKSFSADTYIFVAKDVKYSLLCPLIRANNYFLCSKPPRGIIKKSYDVKCNYFTLTLPCLCTFSY